MRPANLGSFGVAQAFSCAAKGVLHAARTQRNFKIQVGFGIAAAALGIALRIDAGSWIAVIACIGMVLGLECVNTAIEAAVDLVAPEYHDLARIAKDCAAGGVLVASFASLAIGIMVFAPRLLALFGF